MTTWLIIFCLGLAGLIILHGHRQQKMMSSAPDLRDAGTLRPSDNLPDQEDDDALQHNDASPASLYVSDSESSLALNALQSATPRIYRMTFAGSRWAEIAVTLYDGGARYDAAIGAYHFMKNGDLLFTTAAEGQHGRLPDPLNRMAYKEAIPAILLLLPEKEGAEVHDGHEHLLDMARELVTTGGGKLEAKEFSL